MCNLHYPRSLRLARAVSDRVGRRKEAKVCVMLEGGVEIGTFPGISRTKDALWTRIRADPSSCFFLSRG